MRPTCLRSNWIVATWKHRRGGWIVFGAYAAILAGCAMPGEGVVDGENNTADKTEVGPPGAPGPQGPQGSPGLNCWDTNGNGVGDAEEDINHDGAFDAADCQGAVPDSAFVLGASAIPPAGFSFTGITFDTGDEWTSAAPMPTELAGHAMIGLDGGAFVIGGINPGGDSQRADVLRYDPVTNLWSFRAPIPTSRGLMAAAAANGRIYVISGVSSDPENGQFITDAVEEYDPIANVWTRKAPIPTPRQAAVAATVDGKIYVVGGAGGSSGEPIATVEVYDPTTDSWAIAADIPTARLGAAIGAIDGKIYVAGGGLTAQGDDENPILDVLEEYDPVNNAWTTRASMPRGMLLPAYTVADRRLYVLGGAPQTDPLIISDAVAEYDPKTDQWRSLQSMATPCVIGSATTLDDQILVTGGSPDGQNVLASHEQYTVPSTLYVHAKD
jgi:N-acetylneuraminic acid mutarotase